MLRKESEVVPKHNSPVHQEKEFGSGQPAPVVIFQRIYEIWDRELDKTVRYLEQHSSSLEQDARQPRLAMEADGIANTNTRERTEGAATAVQAMHGESFTPRRVEPGPKTSTGFGVKAEPPALPCRDDDVVESGDAALESCLPSLEMRSSTAAGGLVPTCETTTATETTVNKPLLQFYSTEENSKKKKLRTLTQYVSYDSSVFHKSKLLPAPSSLRVIETKSMQIRTFDPGGSQGHPRACSFLGS